MSGSSGTASGQAPVNARRLDIQGLRALAVLMVVAFHAGLPTPGGFVGVDVFFVISGFVIARVLLGELEGSERIDLGAFYARRIRRLLPALALLLVIVAALATVLLGPCGPQQATANTSIGASLFAANLQLFRTPSGYFDLASGSNALLHTWSLSLEEQFYFVFPTTLLVAWRLARRFDPARPPRRLVGMLVLVASALSFALSLAASQGRGSTVAHALGGTVAKLAFYMPVTRAWEFGLGILVALWTPERLAVRRAACAPLGLVGLAALGLAATRRIDVDAFPGAIALLPVGGTALLVAAGADGTCRITRVLGWRPLCVLGDLSYSWYLWHWPFIVLARAWWPGSHEVALAAALVALAPAWASYRFIEDPIRRRQRLAASHAGTVLAVCAAAALCGALGLREVARAESRSAPVAAIASALRSHADELRGCASGGALDASALARCTWPTPMARGAIFLVGDSNAGQFSEPIAAAGNSLGYDVVIFTRPACPFVDLLVAVPHHDAASCHEFVARTLAALVRRRPALVIVASSSSTYVDDDRIAIRDPRTHRVAADPAGKTALWQTGTAGIFGPLAKAGIPALLVHTAPRFVDLTLATCPYLRIRTDAGACAASVPRALVEQQQAAARSAEQLALRGLSGVHTLDVTDALCSPSRCPARQGSAWLYRDSGHLSVDGSSLLIPEFRDAIRSLTPADAREPRPPTGP